ncbi:MAG: nitrogen regulation protein NR(II) [Kofleriaceae bacterium]
MSQETERLEAMLECAPAFIIAVNREGNIDFINRVLPQYTRESVIGLHWTTFFPPDQQAAMETHFRRMYETEAVQHYESVTLGPNGESITFDSQIAPIRNRNEIVGAILVSQDVTERKRVEAELLASRHMALLGSLAAGVAHEINTPIQFVKDSVEFLSGAAEDLLKMIETVRDLHALVATNPQFDHIRAAAEAAEQRADLSYLEENVPPAFARCLDGLKQISKIVRSLKDFAHPSGEDVVAVDLNSLVESAITIAVNEYKLVADLHVELGDLPPVYCHPTEIRQVVLNLLVNAAHAIADVVKGTNRKGVITVATRMDGAGAVISVRDTGTGIPPAIRTRIFDPFFTTKEVGRGTGQGLSIAWSMVKEHHGGELTFETEVGQGTTFFVRLPMIAEAASAAA